MLGSLRSLVRPERVETHAVKGVDLRIERGELIGFLGPNGAGKTTTLKMLSGILFPTSGQSLVLGYVPHRRDPQMLRQISLVMGNKQQLWWDLPAWDSCLVLKELYEVDDAQFKRRVDRLVEALDLGDKVRSQVRKMSLGERMKCELVAALLHNPQIVFLDEPTIGLDVVSQKRIRDFLKEFHAEEGCTILLTSHYMQDVQELCDRVIVIDHGAIVFEGTLDYLSAKFSDSRRLKLTLSEPVDSVDLAKFGKLIEQTDSQVTFEVLRSETAAVTGALLQALPVIDVAIEEVDIEEVIRDLFTSGRP
jgi:ABC-2 type transport system ATP-binding protein